MKLLKNSRFGLLLLAVMVFAGVSFVTRTLLLLGDIAEVDSSVSALVKVYGVGLFYDLVSALYFVLPLALYLLVMPQRIFRSKVHRIIFLAGFFASSYFVLFNGVSEWFFWEEFGKRFNFIAVDYLVYTHEVIQNIVESYPLPLLLGGIFVVNMALFLLLLRKTPYLSLPFGSDESFGQRFRITAPLFLLALIAFFGMEKQNLSEISENQYNNELAKNGIYSFVSAFRNNEIDYNEFYESKKIANVLAELDRLEGFDSSHLKEITPERPEIRPNIMLIMVESLSAEYMGIFGTERGDITPNLDKLAKESLFFDNLYATGTRTVRGMEAVTLSIPPTPGRSIVKRPDNHGLFSAGFITKERGYDNRFIYAGNGYFDNMNDFFGHNGFEIVDRDSFSDDEITFANVWGVCDGDLYDKAIREADKSYGAGKPFFNYIMTTSNHRPYTYPDGKIDIPSHTGRNGAVKYTDFAIGDFIEKARSKPWFDNTIFVVIADHNGGSAGKSALPLCRYRIPLIVYAPKLIAPQRVSRLASQIDTMPTLFSLMGWKYRSKFYGSDILAQDYKPRAFIGNYQRLGLVRDGKLSILEPDKSIHGYTIEQNSLRDTKYRDANVSGEEELDTVTYYQSASYLYANHLYDWNGTK